MPEWKEYKRIEKDGVEVIIEERTDLRNQHGALEYLIQSKVDGHSILHERVSQSKWLGHCCGQLLISDIVERTKKLCHL